MKKNQQFFHNKIATALLVYFVAIVVWWLMIFFSGLVDDIQNYLFGLFFALIPFFGGITGLWHSRQWGGIKSTIGRTLTFLSLGLITWAIGTFIFAYYNLVLAVAVPYPSIADLAYIISWPLWALGMVNLSRATGVTFQLRKTGGKIGLLVIPILIIFASYYLLFIVARGGEIDWSGGMLKLFFDLAYPVGDIVILSLAILVYGLSFNYLGGKFKIPIIIILIGFLLSYFADFSFSYTTTVETFYVASWVDLLFATTMFFLSLGINLIRPSDD